MAFWLDKIGGLMAGPVKLHGDTELTRDEYTELFEYAPEHRARALPIIRRKTEFAQLQDDYHAAVTAEIDARGVDEAAAEALRLAEEAYNAAAAIDPETPKDALEATRTVAAETAEKAAKANEAVEALEPKTAEMETVLASLPPKRQVA